MYYISMLNHANLFLHTDLEIGFKYRMYTVREEEGSLAFEVEPKNNVEFKIPVSFNLTDVEGSALSEFLDSLA